MSRYIIFLTFVYISLLVKEFPPFTKSDMYNYFPEEISVFYITDSENKILPFKEYYHYSIFDISHNYSAIRNTNNSEDANKILKNKMEDYRQENALDNPPKMHIEKISMKKLSEFNNKIIKSL